MTTAEIRVLNLRKLIGEKKRADFCNQYDLDAAYLWQIENGRRTLGEKAARKLEAKLGLEAGALDRIESAGPGLYDVEQSVPTANLIAERAVLYASQGLLNEDEAKPILALLDMIASKSRS